MLLANGNLAPGWIFLIVLAAFALIAVIAFVIYRLLRPKLKQKEEDKPTEQDYAKEELDRILEPDEDEKVSKEIQEYKQNDDEDVE